MQPHYYYQQGMQYNPGMQFPQQGMQFNPGVQQPGMMYPQQGMPGMMYGQPGYGQAMQPMPQVPGQGMGYGMQPMGQQQHPGMVAQGQPLPGAPPTVPNHVYASSSGAGTTMPTAAASPYGPSSPPEQPASSPYGPSPTTQQQPVSSPYGGPAPSQQASSSPYGAPAQHASSSPYGAGPAPSQHAAASSYGSQMGMGQPGMAMGMGGMHNMGQEGPQMSGPGSGGVSQWKSVPNNFEGKICVIPGPGPILGIGSASGLSLLNTDTGTVEKIPDPAGMKVLTGCQLSNPNLLSTATDAFTSQTGITIFDVASKKIQSRFAPEELSRDAGVVMRYIAGDYVAYASLTGVFIVNVASKEVKVVSDRLGEWIEDVVVLPNWKLAVGFAIGKIGIMDAKTGFVTQYLGGFDPIHVFGSTLGDTGHIHSDYEGIRLCAMPSPFSHLLVAAFEGSNPCIVVYDSRAEYRPLMTLGSEILAQAGSSIAIGGCVGFPCGKILVADIGSQSEGSVFLVDIVQQLTGLSGRGPAIQFLGRRMFACSPNNILVAEGGSDELVLYQVSPELNQPAQAVPPPPLSVSSQMMSPAESSEFDFLEKREQQLLAAIGQLQAENAGLKAAADPFS